ncbi:MAG TPA: glutamate--tRNA ligase [Dehalococcoidia bacterium]|nr:glutamate--tRNA ligase [Dehalococcoidia bacterium]
MVENADVVTTPVRVRFAPSPTGTPHIGNIRTALFDWLLARSTGGKFVLRIEDTDRNRFVPGSVEELYESLHWLGLQWDEGPDVGGPFAPYFQSQRLELYHRAAHRLIEAGHAFECFCTPERLDEMRNRQRELKQPPGYDGLCSTNEGRAQAKALAGGRPPVVRFNMPDEGTTIVPDFLRGPVSFENARLDDTVLLKSDGFPTYHLAVVVDDHEMEITHVIRGEEWLPSAPLHKRIYDALGYEMPVLLHTPSILGTDKSKLSKRHGAQSVLEYRDAGYLPEAVFNFLGLLGWSLDDKTEIISREEFVRHFTIDRLLKSPAVFNKDKLDWMNAQYMQQMPVPELARLIIEWLDKPEDEGGLPEIVQRPLDLEYTGRIVPLVRERVKLLPEARDMMAFYYLPGGVDPDVDMLLGKAFKDDRSRAQLLCSEALVTAEAVASWTADALTETYTALAERLEASRRDLFGLIRVAVTGRTVAPPLFETMEILGRERCVLRLREALGIL